MSSSETAPAPSTPGLTLSDIPVEVLGLVQKYIDPADIISLRKTCKHAAASTRDRSVWINALRHICQTHGVFSPTYPLKEMTQEALELAALTPFRFASQLTKAGPISPFATRILKSRGLFTNGPGKLTRIEEEGKFVDFCLVPGGRFLLTRTENNIIQLWDLGYGPECMVKPIPVASITRASGNDRAENAILAIQPSHNGNGIYLILSEVLMTGPELSVYEILLTDATPSFRRVRSLRVHGEPITIMASSPGRFAFHRGDYVTVWDFISQSIVSWNVQEVYSSLLLLEKNILLFDPTRFTLWKIPPLQKASPTPPAITSEQLPIFTFTHPRPGNNDEILVPFDSWPQGDGRPVYFSLMVHTDNGPVLDYYMMKPLNENHDHFLPPSIPVHMASIEIDSDFTEENPGPLRFCDKWLVQPFIGPYNAFTVNITDMSSARQGELVTHTHQICPIMEAFNIQKFAFCPVSARLCGMVDGNEIRVMDYIVSN